MKRPSLPSVFELRAERGRDGRLHVRRGTGSRRIRVHWPVLTLVPLTIAYLQWKYGGVFDRPGLLSAALLLIVAWSIARLRPIRVGIDGIAVPGRFLQHADIVALTPNKQRLTLKLKRGPDVVMNFDTSEGLKTFLSVIRERREARERHTAAPPPKRVADGYREVRVETSTSELERLLEGEAVDEEVRAWAKSAMAAPE